MPNASKGNLAATLGPVKIPVNAVLDKTNGF
jgi:hypothetical protein